MTNLATSPEIHGVQRLLADLFQSAQQHRAVRHPWLDALANGQLLGPELALRDFAGSYYAYSKRFPQFLRAVIDALEVQEHRDLLGHNLAEESGKLDDEMRDELREAGIDVHEVDGIPHPVLFKRFYAAADGDSASTAAVAAGERWALDLLEFLRNATPAAAVGALGLGTESIVRDVYTQVIAGFDRLAWPSASDRVFFDLHCLVDDQHQEDLLHVATDLAQTPAGRAELRHGMEQALAMRARYFDALKLSASWHQDRRELQLGPATSRLRERSA